ncbi:MAG: chemotaxis protein CheX, partial [Planctomycetota bacterium]
MAEAVDTVFQKMGEPVRVHEVQDVQREFYQHSIIASLTMEGEGVEATMNLLFPELSARHLATVMSGGEAPPDMDTVRDAVGELNNLISGGVAGRLRTCGFELHLALPAVVSGFRIQFSWHAAA